MIKTGGCQCGNVRYETTGEPMNQLFCYCTECQKQTGSDKWFGVWFAYDNFKFTGIEPKTFTRKGSSGADVINHFCSECGTTICADITIGKFITVNGPSFDEDSHLAPKMAIFAASAPKWSELPSKIPVFKLFPSDMG
ncbi:GFA family protein [Vibrio parahaemolyticus]|nr:GFA family protein [Vibrio parahaemolyticus]